MSKDELAAIANALVAPGKGLIAIDESNRTCNKRFEEVGIAPTEENRRAYRELILTTPGLGSFISGAILYDETIRESTKDGDPFVKVMTNAGIIPGIKVDTGAKDLAAHPGEKVTEGLDGLRERLAEYYKMGARFAKWRAVIRIGAGLPSEGCIEANAHALTRYAALCQEGGLLPIVEPEVLMDGDHSIECCAETTEKVQRAVFNQLYTQRVAFELMILKPNMVLPGREFPKQADVEQVADATVNCLLRAVPAAVCGIAFLSGGQGCAAASAHLNAMNSMKGKSGSRIPWPLTFSYARAIQQPALHLWKGLDSNVKAAQEALLYRAKCNSAARQGKYSEKMEHAGPAPVGLEGLHSHLSSQD
jgi:fructose-bisphosphate aldolase, class I